MTILFLIPIVWGQW